MKKIILLAMLLLVVVISGCSSGNVTEQQTTETITTENSGNALSETTIVELLGQDGFSPMELTVNKGTEVTFFNQMEKDRTLTFQKENSREMFNSPLIGPNDSFSHIFDTEGTYLFWDVGYGVKAKVIVQ